MSSSNPKDKPLVSLAEQLHAAEMYEEFCELMFSLGTPYAELLVELEKWSIYSSLGALSRFKASHRGPWAMERAKREQKNFLEENGADLDDATRRLVAMRIFADAAAPDTSTRDVLRMRDQYLQEAKLKQDAVKLEQAERKLDQAQEQIEMQRRKIEALEAQAAAAAEAAQRAKDVIKAGGMTDDQRQLLLQEMDHMILGKPKPKQPTQPEAA